MIRALLARKRVKTGGKPAAGMCLEYYNWKYINVYKSILPLPLGQAPGTHDVAAAKIQKGNNQYLGVDVEYLDVSETPSEAEDNFEESRKEEALSAARISQRESMIFDQEDE